MDEKLYTEKELMQYLGRSETTQKKRQGVDRITTMCRQAGLIIAPVAETLKGKGSTILYRIVEDKFNIPGEVWVDVYCSPIEHEVSNLGRIRQKESKKLMGSKMDSGYITIGFGRAQRNLRAHRIVYFSFHPEQLEQEQYLVIDHINGKRDDNRLENLQALSNLENKVKGKNDQNDCKTLVAQLLLKYGYEETKKKLQQLLDEE